MALGRSESQHPPLRGGLGGLWGYKKTAKKLDGFAENEQHSI